MRFHKSNILLICSATALLTACDVYELPSELEDVFKTPISLSIGGIDTPVPATRAVITDGTGKTMQAFDKDAYIFMVMQSDYGTDDFGGSHDTKYNVTRGDVAEGQGTVTFTDNNKRYWDDAHARSTQLNIWAYAQKGQKWTTCSFQEITGTDSETSDTYKKEYQTGGTTVWPWQTQRIYPAIREWKVAYTTNYPQQTADDLEKQDLLFSNNLSYNQEKSWPDNRLKFDFTNRKFPTENVMKFYHAMSKITIQIKAGDGFKGDGTDFALKNGTIDLLSGFNTMGLFNIKDGEFQMIHESLNITSIPLVRTTVGKTEPYYTLEALAIPNIHQFMKSHSGVDTNSRFVDGSNNIMLQFTIDNNMYQITSDDLFDAITGKTNATTLTDNGTYVPLEAGKNYVFTFTVGKTKIQNLTAQVAEWETVNADNVTPSNARIKLQLEERGEAQTTDVAFYKANDNKTTDGIDDNYTTYNWKSGYTNLGATYADGHWSTNYFWESNKDFYHFRALMPDETVVTSDAEGDYASLTSGASYTDVRWGAPMKDDGDNETSGTFRWTYDPVNYGFDNADHTQIYKAIGPTEDPVKLILFHMMSDLTFKITTTTGDDKVTLVDGDNKTKVEIVGFYPGGKVLLGTGLVKTTGTGTETRSVAWNSVDEGVQVYKYGAVPQDLTAVKLYITTPDNNQYIVDLNDVKATSVTTANIVNPYTLSDGKYVISRWYPGFKYVYSFTLKKTGITNLVATVVNWETITADNETVVIK